jgi:hypothetical protein
MATIVTRAGKGSPLTNTELDSNFTNINAQLSTAVITGGTINNASIGGTTPSSVAATTLSATGHTTFEGITSTGATGTGKIVYDNTPTLVTPVLGVATATSVTVSGVVGTSATDALVLPSGTTGQRGASIAGKIRYNSTTSSFEGYGTTWGSIGGGSNSQQYFTATAGQTVFSLSFSYDIGLNTLFVFVNGSKQIVSLNYLETSTTSITFLTGLNLGDIVEVVTV